MFELKISVKRVAIMLFVALAAIGLLLWTRPPVVRHVVNKMEGKKTVEDRLAEYGDAARSRLKPVFAGAGVAYPPKRLVFAGLKQERVLQVYAEDNQGRYRFIKSYPILAVSGHAGPKLREGDYQVPEGIYRIEFLNPNSLYHLSMRVGYPNEFDRAMAEKERRTNLGGDIMIHGSDCSIGCLAMGDPASEDLFVLVADTGTENVKVILSPVDFRKTKLDTSKLDLPEWTDDLYKKVSKELADLPLQKD